MVGTVGPGYLVFSVITTVAALPLLGSTAVSAMGAGVVLAPSLLGLMMTFAFLRTG